jgi:acetylornithine/succinyldiaminopimelate/putrescine aminotransferase
MGALSATWDDHYRAPFAPLVPGVTFADPAHPDALDALVTNETAALVIEPIQGEGGVRPMSPALAAAVKKACARTGALLILDEVQSGSWRTGAFLHGPSLGLSPDLVALGKALGAGVPIGATMLSSRVAQTIQAGDHGTTYGGNLLACRAALTFLDVMDGGVATAMPRVSAHLFSGLRALAGRSQGRVVDIRGTGLIAGLELRADAAPVVAAALEHGLLVNRTGGSIIRLLPPYIVTEKDVDEALRVLEVAIGTI